MTGEGWNCDNCLCDLVRSPGLRFKVRWHTFEGEVFWRNSKELIKRLCGIHQARDGDICKVSMQLVCMADNHQIIAGPRDYTYVTYFLQEIFIVVENFANAIIHVWKTHSFSPVLEIHLEVVSPLFDSASHSAASDDPRWREFTWDTFIEISITVGDRRQYCLEDVNCGRYSIWSGQRT